MFLFWKHLPRPKTLRQKYSLALWLQALLVVAGALTAVYSLRVSAELSSRLAGERLGQLQMAQELVETTLLIERESYRLLKAGSLAEMHTGYAEALTQVERLDGLVEKLGRTSSDVQVLALHESGQLFRNSLNILVKLLEKTLRSAPPAGSRNVMQSQLHRLHEQLQEQAVNMVGAAHHLSVRFAASFDQTVEELNAASKKEQRVILALLIGSLLLAWLVARFFFGHHVVRRLLQISHYLRSGKSEGLSPQIPVRGNDEIGEMARVVEQFLENRSQLASTKDSLRQSEEVLRTLIDSAPIAIVGLDLEGKVEVVWSRGAEQMFGWRAEEVMGKILPTVAEHNLAEFRGLHEQVCSGVVQDGIEVQRQRRDGSRIDYSIYGGPRRNAGGEIIGTIAVFADITARKKLEEEIVQRNSELERSNAKLEQAYTELKATQSQLLQQEKMASIGQLAAGVAHEINNPLGFILSNLRSLERYFAKLNEYQQGQQLALDQAARGSMDLATACAEVAELRKRLKIDYIHEDLTDLIQESIDGGQRVRKIVQNLKGFARIDEEQWQEADLNEGLESTLNIVWNEIKYKADVHKDYGQLPLLSCNAGQLNQVFMNLLINAAQAIEGQGEIRIVTRCDGEEILIEISDNGCGIPAADLSHIFEPFFTTKEVGAGTGLGLSIAYDIITQHKGQIAVASEPGKGTSFTIHLPLAQATC
ncbi:ATP-binding protein [Pelobacter seleniigenes]|uniref:ATP-binding protein n=1 Tax=Pelobacter seleniigenes TaxID=407188 RepID=UPI000690E284|nr:ATP-binding protein [Pelobacter seleniigenes]